MKTSLPRFSVPDCILDEPMPSKALKLLLYLIRESDYSGACRPGYDAMQHMLRDRSQDKGSRTNVKKCLAVLDKMGWIFTMKRTNARMAIWLQIPHRLRKQKAPPSTISIVQ